LRFGPVAWDAANWTGMVLWITLRGIGPEEGIKAESVTGVSALPNNFVVRSIPHGGRGVDGDGLLCQAVEELPSVGRPAAFKAESELVQVIVEVFVRHRSDLRQ
jgi:hypothetical protein